MIYQTILLGHNALLFKLLPTPLFGVIGSLFSLLYLTINLTNAGLDASLSPLWSSYKESKDQITSRLVPQIALQIGILLIVCIGAIVLTPSHIKEIPIPKITLGALLLIEGLKKTVRTILHLAFYNHLTTAIELAVITSYVSSIWFWYALGNPITLQLIFFPLLICSLVATIILLFSLYRFYQQLPERSDGEKTAISRIIANRFFTSVSQASHQLLSSNFLVPFFALYAGLEQAGMLKLVSTSAHCITTIGHKIIGLTTQAVWSNARQMRSAEIQSAFASVSQTMFHIIVICLCVFAGTSLFFLSNQNFLSRELVFILLLYSAILILDHVFTWYETFMVAQERAAIVCLITLAMLCTMGLLIQYACVLAASTCIIGFLLLRLGSCIAIGTVAFYLWQIKLTVPVPSSSIAYPLIAFFLAFSTWAFIIN